MNHHSHNIIKRRRIHICLLKLQLNQRSRGLDTMESRVSTLLVLFLIHCSVSASEECPCVHREADPLFPGADGTRWDCEYLNGGLLEVPASCWDLHPDVTQIFLDYNNIAHVDVNSFKGLTQLQVLSLAHNNIAGIEEGALGDLTSLKFLDMSSNKILDPPVDMWNLAKLTFLDLSDNHLTEVQHYNISKLVNLEVLDLHLNRLRQIPYHSLEPLSKLQKLHLHWNQFVVLPIVHENLELEEVLVNGNAVLDFPKDMFGNLTKPLTYHFVDNPAFDVHGAMLLPLPDHSHIVMGNDVSIWVDDEAQATEILNKIWVVKDGLSQDIDISTLIRICGLDKQTGRMPPC